MNKDAVYFISSTKHKTKRTVLIQMFHFNMKKFFLFVLAAAMCLSSVNALACTAIYVGSDLTADGSTMFARSEDLTNSYNKLYSVVPAGVHTAGEEYVGCYGFTYTFTKDSYGYTAFCDDNGQGYCPDCGGEHAHTPYQAGGTNEKGLTVSATETLYYSQAMAEVDPYVDTGIEEAEITTVLLSEAATAKEALDLLLSIYESAGCCNGSGIFLADHQEVWYVENASGTQYVAVKLNSSMAFAEPNVSVIGLVDLDDTENVIASADVIAVAEKAGTYVGDKEANTIDYSSSYTNNAKPGSRMIDALKYFNAELAKDEPSPADFCISNVDAEGNIVPLYTNIVLDHVYSIEDMVGYYHIPGIGKTGNLETHIFQIFAEDSLTDTVEWIAMDDACYNAFVPYYPMLTTDVYAAYKTSTAPAAFVEEKPESGVFYAATKNKRNAEGERVKVEGFTQLPDAWADGFYWTMDALSNLIEYTDVTDEQKAAVNTTMDDLQKQCYEAYAKLQAEVAAADTTEAAAAAATAISMEMAQTVHTTCVGLVNDLLK